MLRYTKPDQILPAQVYPLTNERSIVFWTLSNYLLSFRKVLVQKTTTKLFDIRLQAQL